MFLCVCACDGVLYIRDCVCVALCVCNCLHVCTGYRFGNAMHWSVCLCVCVCPNLIMLYMMMMQYLLKDLTASLLFGLGRLVLLFSLENIALQSY